jgi:hypothetical protein
MIFTPYEDEVKVINLIHKYHSGEYALLRMTSTMIEKNNIDANGIFRDILQNEDILNFDDLLSGGTNGISKTAMFIQEHQCEDIGMKFYLVTNKRGDRRFSINRIKRKSIEKEINVGDLLYFSTLRNTGQETKIIIINLTHNIPDQPMLESVFGADIISETFNELYPKILKIVHEGYHNNSKGFGKVSPKDVGDTLEYLLGIETNNSPLADYKGIEIKSKVGKTLDTLFTLRPQFEGTSIAMYEPIDRNRVSAFARYYGYDSDKHLGAKSLYITIGSKEFPQNNQGFYLEVNEEEKRVNLCGINPTTKKIEITAYWSFSELKAELFAKHPATLWVKAEFRMYGEMGQFKYTEMELSRAPQFTTFLALIKSGGITYDWRGYTSMSGKYVGKNHGNAWRIKPRHKTFLFGEIEKVQL